MYFLFLKLKLKLQYRGTVTLYTAYSSTSGTPGTEGSLCFFESGLGPHMLRTLRLRFYGRLRLQAHRGCVRRLGAELHVDGLLVGHTARRLHVLDDPAMRIEELPNLS